ncbi:hypothetical protein O0I10_008667 [Lichtheimia ornata]|uniref:Uncharacterized protein n=1 Tax=Lichtheimia ornata TaxID=688661 RepID=A0AAD7XSR7_9FUNG|nr:uncharacterized protein O0I10_008667 [Lichtheimia ornata]KAJ8655579.1 hypothetical protein O0I10_008667 [Lichtheimia ornata]
MSNEKETSSAPVENSFTASDTTTTTATTATTTTTATTDTDMVVESNEPEPSSRPSESGASTNSVTTGNKRPASQQSHDHGYRQRIASWIQHESDTDLYIRSLSESLMIHKEIVERIENEKEQYIEAVEQERKQERKHAEQERQAAHQALETQRQEYDRLMQAHQNALVDLDKKRNEYARMEANYYSHMRTIRATDDDLSTVQSELSAVLSQTANLCMSLRSKADKVAGARFVLEHWPEKEALIREHMLSKQQQQQQQPAKKPDTEDDQQQEDQDEKKEEAMKEENKEDEPMMMDVGFIGVFIEKYLVNMILSRILQQSLHPGVPINDAFQQVFEWMDKRNTEWATRLRQQMVALVARQAMDDESAIEDAKQALVKEMMESLSKVYPHVDGNTEKKLTNIVNRATKLNLAIKGQEVLVKVREIEEGEATFDSSTMKAASKGKAEGTVTIVISPGFSASDPTDEEHGFLVPAKVLCL